MDILRRSPPGRTSNTARLPALLYGRILAATRPGRRHDALEERGAVGGQRLQKDPRRGRSAWAPGIASGRLPRERDAGLAVRPRGTRRTRA